MQAIPVIVNIYTIIVYCGSCTNVLKALLYFKGMQFAYPCAKYKARKAFLLCSGVLYRYHSVFSRAAFSKIGLA